MATHNDLVGEGNRIDAALETMQRIVMDKSTISEQSKQVKANATAKQTRLALIRTALDRDCDGCGHSKTGHVSGMGKCLYHVVTDPCECKEWHVNV